MTREPDTTTGRGIRRAGTEQRRQELVAMASRLIFERGFDNLSVNDLAEGMGMSVGGMYRYIKTKTDLLVMACEGIYGDLRDRVVEVARGPQDVAGMLRDAIAVYFDACNNNRDLILLTYREYQHLPPDAQRRYQDREEAIADVFADLIRSGMGRGVFNQVNAEIVARDIIMLGHMPALKGWSLRGHTDPDGVAAAHLDLILGRLVAAPQPS
jgi:AcrR family transcriptional regulator